MPSTSAKQARAMRAAAAGDSTLGIPENVGKDFVAADDALRGIKSKHHGTRTDHTAKGLAGQRKVWRGA